MHPIDTGRWPLLTPTARQVRERCQPRLSSCQSVDDIRMAAAAYCIYLSEQADLGTGQSTVEVNLRFDVS